MLIEGKRHCGSIAFSLDLARRKRNWIADVRIAT